MKVLDETRNIVCSNNGYWTYYACMPKIECLDLDEVGKWMWFFTDIEKAKEICQKAVLSDACIECKHTGDLDFMFRATGVACFYLNGFDIEMHKSILKFMLAEDLIPRCENGELEDIGFKYDYQTRAGEYGDAFVPKIVLSDFVDLRTGCFKE